MDYRRFVRLAMKGHVVNIRDLPTTLTKVLREIGYGKSDVEVIPSESESITSTPDDNMRAFYSLVNLETGAHTYEQGDFGGGGLSTTRSRVDSDRSQHRIPENAALIKGVTGNGKMWARVYVHPNMFPTLLPTAGGDLSYEELHVLYAVDALNSRGRVDHFDYYELGPYGPQNPHVKSLEDKGLLTIQGNGSIKITTDGKNAAPGSPPRR